LLYAQAEAFARSQGATTLSVVHYPYHLVAGIPSESSELTAFLGRQGFEGWREAYDVHRQLIDPTLGEQLADARRRLPERVHIRSAERGDEGGIIDFVGREFPGGWHYDTKRFFAKGGAPSDLLVALDDDTIVGFAHTHTSDSVELRGSIHWIALRPGRWGGLGPIGIAAARRRRGLGFALLSAGVQHLRAQGVEDLVIDWTDLVDFYGRLGFRIWKRYWQGSKSLQGESVRPPLLSSGSP
jgi:predicted N-acetyltransferase YhbS